MLTFGSFFSGIGGIDLGLERAGLECKWQVENDPWCCKVLEKNWPDVQRYTDIKELTGAELASTDIICGGFPCQNVSDSGDLTGIEGEQSGLWLDFSRLVRRLRPRYVLVENTTGLLARGMGRVLSDLAASGYDTEWDSIPAAAFDAPHLRARIWILAYPAGIGNQERSQVPVFAGRVFSQLRTGWDPEPDVVRLAHGLPPGLAARQLRGLGNAVVPRMAQYLGERILAAEGELTNADRQAWE